MEAVDCFGCLSGGRCIFYGVEAAKVFGFAVHPNLGNPATLGAPMNTANPGFVVAVALGVTTVFLMGNIAQVAYAVVFSISVDVVDHAGWMDAEYVKPSQAMGWIRFTQYPDTQVAMTFCACLGTCLPSWELCTELIGTVRPCTSEFTRFRFIMYVILELLLSKHLEHLSQRQSE